MKGEGKVGTARSGTRSSSGGLISGNVSQRVQWTPLIALAHACVLLLSRVVGHDTLAVVQLLHNFGLNGGFQRGNSSSPRNQKKNDLGAGQVEPFFESCGFVSPISLVKSSYKVFAERKSLDNSRSRWIIVSHHCRSTLASSAAGSKPLPVYVRLLPSSEPCFVAAWTEAVWLWSRMQILCSRFVPELGTTPRKAGDHLADCGPLNQSSKLFGKVQETLIFLENETKATN